MPWACQEEDRGKESAEQVRNTRHDNGIHCTPSKPERADGGEWYRVDRVDGGRCREAEIESERPSVAHNKHVAFREDEKLFTSGNKKVCVVLG